MTKLEEIALAIHRARYPDAAVMDGIEGLGPTVAAQALVEARAALGPLRELTEAMQDELNKLAQCEGYIPEGWRAAIDAILNEKPGA